MSWNYDSGSFGRIRHFSSAQPQGVCNHGAARLTIDITMKSWRRLLFCLAVVTALYAFHVHLKTTKIFSNPTWDAQDEVGQFWSEGAFQYRFAKFFASHPIRDWGQLSRDRAVQYPDTIDDWAEFTVAMEVPVGVLYRWLNPAMPLHVFVVWYDCLVSSSWHGRFGAVMGRGSLRARSTRRCIRAMGGR